MVESTVVGEVQRAGVGVGGGKSEVRRSRESMGEEGEANWGSH